MDQKYKKGSLEVDWKDKYKNKLITAEAAANLVQSGDKVVSPLVRRPSYTLLALGERANSLKNVIVKGNWWFPGYRWLKPGVEDAFIVQEHFTTRHTRQAMRERRHDWVGGIAPGAQNRQRISESVKDRGFVYAKADVAIIFITPPNEEGYSSFGHLTWWQPLTAETAKTVIAEVDPSLPWTYGEKISISEIDYLVDSPFTPSEGFYVPPAPSPDEFAKKEVIAALASELVKDKNTLQLRINTTSKAVARFLGSKNDLGLDTEILTNDMVSLRRSRNRRFSGRALGRQVAAGDLSGPGVRDCRHDRLRHGHQFRDDGDSHPHRRSRGVCTGRRLRTGYHPQHRRRARRGRVRRPLFADLRYHHHEFHGQRL